MRSSFWKYFLLAAISFTLSIFGCQFFGDQWEQPVRTVLYKIRNDSVPAESKEYVDSAGIPFVIYDELNGITAGKQYNPTIVCNYAIDYYHQLQKDQDEIIKSKFLNCANWLQENLTDKNGYALYVFNWQQPWYDSVGKPYTSGMTSGLAAQVLTDAYKLTREKSYLRSAKALVNGFYIPIQSGGFTYKNDDGWWYEELADTAMHTPFILDGHIFAITGVYEYWKKTKEDSAKFIVDKGLAALKKSLPYFDIGNGWAYYDKYKKPADKKYQRTLTHQMKQLWEITGDSSFYNYYIKWKAPLSKPYIIRVVKERNISGITLFIIIAAAVFFILILFFKRAKWL